MNVRSSPLPLFVLATTIWGSTWLVIKWQLGVVAPEVSVAYRFALAAAVLGGFCLLTGRSLRFAARDHALFALQGALMFGFSYLCVYWAEQHIVSGLVAVVFALFTVMNVFTQRLMYGTPVTARAIAGATLAVAGVAVLFVPELAAVRGDRETVLGIGLALAGTALSALGGLPAARVHQRGHPVMSTSAWAMLYGAALTAAVAALRGRPWAFDASPSYVASLAYLALAGTVVSFVAYLALMRRVGMARASYTGVWIPVIALLLSTAFEGYRLTLYTLAGAALVVAGNLIVLRRDRGSAAADRRRRAALR